jgi:signal transduction histidine kinase
VPADLAGDAAFNAALRKTLNFYQVNLDYRLALDHSGAPDTSKAELYQCAISLPTNTGRQAAYINLEFPEKQAFMRGKMSFMLLATVLILLFTAAVFWFANWSLLQQKRLLQTNVDFFNNMAHEFRTPLTNVGLAINMVSKKHEALKNDPLLDIIRQENTKLLNQVERVLHLAGLENGDYALQKERIPLNTLLQAIVAELAMQIEAKKAVVHLEVVPENIEVFGDRLHLGNVFRNLLDNALKYSPSAPEIRISAHEHPKGMLIEVQDNGLGIPPSESSLIFEKFQRISRGNVHEQKGFGLGLAYVKSMVELHKGTVRVRSEPNRGSCFEVFLPSFSR